MVNGIQDDSFSSFYQSINNTGRERWVITVIVFICDFVALSNRMCFVRCFRFWVLF